VIGARATDDGAGSARRVSPAAWAGLCPRSVVGRAWTGTAPSARRWTIAGVPAATGALVTGGAAAVARAGGVTAGRSRGLAAWGRAKGAGGTADREDSGRADSGGEGAELTKAGRGRSDRSGLAAGRGSVCGVECGARSTVGGPSGAGPMVSVKDGLAGASGS
jgi:hypothetical protein